MPRYGSKRGSRRRSYSKKRPFYYKGRGAYRKKRYARKKPSAAAALGWNVLNTLGRVGATAAGTYLGGPGGAALATGAYEALSGVGKMGYMAAKGYLSGHGDYANNDTTDIKTNSLMTGGSPAIVNQVANKDTHGGIVLRNCEYIADIISHSTAGSFKLDTYDINPALENTFQWMSQVAANYSEYEFSGLYFEFRTTSVDALNSTNTALGTVIMACQYNSLDPLYANKAEMMNSFAAVSVKPSQSVRFFVECAKSQNVLNNLYTRSGTVPSDGDIRFYDLGRLSIATQGMQAAAVNVGELHVCYECILRKPKLFAALGSYNTCYKSTNDSYTNALPLGNGTQTVAYDTLGPSIDPVGNTISFPIFSVPQQYVVTLGWFGTAVTIARPTYTYTNCSLGTYISSVNDFPATGTASVTQFQQVLSVKTQANLPCYIAISNTPTLPSSGTAFSLRIMQVDLNAV